MPSIYDEYEAWKVRKAQRELMMNSPTGDAPTEESVRKWLKEKGYDKRKKSLLTGGENE